MITFYTVSETTLFSKQFNLSRFPNVIVGTDGNDLLLRSYYHINKTPFVAVHDKLGNFITSYANQIDLDRLAKTIDKLN